MLERVKQTIRQQNLFHSGDSVLVGVSGGVDSVSLLESLLQLKDELSITVAAAHLHHGLRGKEADEDEIFVQELCKKKGVLLFCTHINIREMAEREKMTLEEAGRRARYAFFRDLAKEKGFTKIATAHNANDNAETIVMHFLRGASVGGLAGIPYRNGSVIRPLLDVTRRDIEAYAKEQGLAYRTDSTNQNLHFTRNRIRHVLLPLLERDFNPGLLRTLLTNAGIFSSCQDFIEKETEMRFARLARPVSGGFAFSCRSLQEEEPYMRMALLRRAAHSLAGDREISAAIIEQIHLLLEQSSGAQSIAGNLTARLYDGCLYIRRETPAVTFYHNLPETGRLSIPEIGGCFYLSREVGFRRPEGVQEACLDAEKLAGKQLAVRSRRAGDVFYPTGMTGKKSLREFYIDKKVPRFMRDEIPIVTADEDIIWVVGHRLDARYIAKAGTREILCLQYVEGEQTNDKH